MAPKRRPKRAEPVAVLAVDRALPTPLNRQLYEAYRDAIVEGRIAPGQRLPSTRTLSAELDLARITVVGAFEQLMAEGYIEGRIGAGTFATSALPEGPFRSSGRSGPKDAAPPRPRLRMAKRLEENPVQLLPGTPPFRLSVAALDEFPFQTWARLSARHARDPKRSLLEYGDPMGHRPLREALATHLRLSRGVRCDAEQVMMVSGSQQALDLCARILLPGERVWVEEPGYVGARNAFRLAGARVVPVPVDAQGLVVSQGVRRAPRAEAVYVTPSHQYPLGVTMSAARRLELLEWARRRGAWILEDDYDSEYRYDTAPITALQGLDRQERVIYIGTFSKVLFPALRVGYLVLPRALVEEFRRVRDAIDVFPAAFHQAVLTDFIQEGHYARHLRRMRVLYRERRSALIQALSAEFGEQIDLAGDGAGMHLTITFAQDRPDSRVAERAAKHGVVAMPLSATFAGKPRRNGLVLGYGGYSGPKLREAVAALRRAFEEAGERRR